MKCKRCGDTFVMLDRGQIHCTRCAVEVAAIIEADTKRRTRFRFVKELSPA